MRVTEELRIWLTRNDLLGCITGLESEGLVELKSVSVLQSDYVEVLGTKYKWEGLARELFKAILAFGEYDRSPAASEDTQRKPFTPLTLGRSRRVDLDILDNFIVSSTSSSVLKMHNGTSAVLNEIDNISGHKSRAGFSKGRKKIEKTRSHSFSFIRECNKNESLRDSNPSTFGNSKNPRTSYLANLFSCRRGSYEEEAKISQTIIIPSERRTLSIKQNGVVDGNSSLGANHSRSPSLSTTSESLIIMDIGEKQEGADEKEICCGLWNSPRNPNTNVMREASNPNLNPSPIPSQGYSNFEHIVHGQIWSQDPEDKNKLNGKSFALDARAATSEHDNVTSVANNHHLMVSEVNVIKKNSFSFDIQPSLTIKDCSHLDVSRGSSAPLSTGAAIRRERRPSNQRGAGRGSKTTQSLLHAVMFDCSNGAEEAIMSGADVNARKSNTKETYLHIAVENDSYSLVKLLVEAGSNFDATDLTGATPVHLAAYNGNQKILRLLLKARANPNAMTFENRTPLHLAAERGRFKTIQTLLEESAELELDAIDEDGETALTLASWADSVKCVKLLIEAGADRDHFTTWGNSALHHSIGKRHTEVVRALLQPQLTIMELIPKTNLLNAKIALTISKYVDEGVDLSHRNKQGMSCADICDENQYIEGFHMLMVYATGHGNSLDSIDEGISSFFRVHPRKTIVMEDTPLAIGLDSLPTVNESDSSSFTDAEE